MQSLPGDPVYSLDAVRALDRLAIEEGGIAGYELMNRAARFAFDEARRRWPAAQRFRVVCGGGNNGGDGLVFARLAAEEGFSVAVTLLAEPEALRGDASAAFEDLRAIGLAVDRGSDPIAADADVVIDALFGSGLSRPVTGEGAAAIAAINEHPGGVLSMDVPSGIDGDSGEALGSAVGADLTTTFVGRKAGLYMGDGRIAAGEIRYSDLGIPNALRARVDPRFLMLQRGALAQLLGPRPRDAHKGSFGHVLVIGGASGMSGAARLAGEAALRTGAGLVSVATHPDSVLPVSAGRPELMVRGIAGASDLDPLLDRATVIAIGPGLGTDDWAQALFAALFAAIRDSGLPTVLDADALNLLALDPRPMAGAVLTPHPGEAGRLLDGATADVQSDREAALADLVRRFEAIVVLKGAGTLVGSGDGPPWLSARGNPGMATGGSGDVLTGVIAALIAQGFTPGAAAMLGVELHALAGDRAAASGERGLAAGDLLDELRGCVNP